MIINLSKPTENMKPSYIYIKSATTPKMSLYSHNIGLRRRKKANSDFVELVLIDTKV